MKKIALFALAVFLAFGAYAQKGSMYIGGGVGYGNDTWRVAPEAGIWLANTLQLGLVATFQGSTNNDSTNRNPKLFVGPHLYLRKWWPVGKIFSLYIGANARFISSTNQAEVTSSQFDGFLDAGFALAVAERWGMVGRVMSLGYIDEDFIFDFNMSPMSMFNVGVYYTFKQGKEQSQ